MVDTLAYIINSAEKSGAVVNVNPEKRGASLVEVGAREMSNVKEREGNVVVLHRRYDERFVRFIRAFIAITDPCPDAELEDADGRASEQVLFDIDVDGNRYLLIKTVPVERGAVALSPREREIVRMVAQGRQNKVIAAVLNISSWTVCTHLRRIFAKLGVTSRAAMVAKVADIEGAIDLKDTVEGASGATPRRPA